MAESEFAALGALVAQTEIGAEEEAVRVAVDQAARVALLCSLFGVEREAWVWPFAATGLRGAGEGAARAMLAGVFEPLDGIGLLGTLAGASDLDPMDPGPSHTVLPATLAACIACRLRPPAHSAQANDVVASAVLSGIEAGWRMRSAITGARPGVGFHSPGVFGTLAAAASAARALGLAPQACIDALAIALSRAAGLAVNSAASMVGLTHFGWGAFHGLEAALLASQGWGASHDFRRGLASLYGEDRVRIEALLRPAPRVAPALVFKRYPCNIYLNLVVALLEEADDGPLDRIEVTLPWVPHLDCPQPKDLRQARNSAQAVAAIAGARDLSYAAFSGPPGPWTPSADVARLLPGIELRMDRDAPTGLLNATVGVRAWRGGTRVQDAERSMRDLVGWGASHSRVLIGADDRGSLDAIHGGGYLDAFDHIQRRRRALQSARA